MAGQPAVLFSPLDVSCLISTMAQPRERARHLVRQVRHQRGAEPSGMESQDPIVALYRQYLDRSLLLENLKRTPTERIQRLMEMQLLAEEMRKARRKLRDSK